MNTILGGGSQLNKLSKISEHLNRNSRTVFVELTGDDVAGDGTEGKPFATVARAQQELTGTTAHLIVFIGAGVHNVSHVYLVNGILEINGAGTLNMTGNGSGNLLRVEYGYLLISCAALASDVAVTSVAAIGPTAVCLLNTALSCNNAAQIAAAYYDGAVLIARNSITNTAVAAIPLMVAYNDTTPLVQKYGLTLTNVTG